MNIKESPQNVPRTEGNLNNENIDFCIDKPFHGMNEHFLFNFECNFYTIAKNIQNRFSAIFTLNSVIFTLCYGCVDIIYITKDNSHRQSMGKVVYLGR